MAQVTLKPSGGKPDSVFSFIVREELETTGNRAISFNAATGVLLFDEVQDGNLHNYLVTMQAPGCLPATQKIPFQCTDTGACETVRYGVLMGSEKVAINQPTPYSVTSLAGTTPYRYTWSLSGGVLSSNSTAATTATFNQVGTYTLSVQITNCGNSPITLTKTIQVVLETCEKTNNTCYYYSTPFPTFNEAFQAACIDNSTFVLGSFSNALNLGSVAYNSSDLGSCTKLSAGYYAVKTSSNGCSVNSVPASIIGTTIQIDSEGKIVGVQPFTCEVSATSSSITQPLCMNNTLTPAQVSFTGVSNADRYVVCEGSSFNCTMTSPTGFINGSTVVVTIPAPKPGTSSVFTVRFYNGSDFNKFKDVPVTITSPTGCGVKTPTPVLLNAEVFSVTNNGEQRFVTRLTGTTPCPGTMLVYLYNSTTQGYDPVYTTDVVEANWQITPTITGVNRAGQLIRVSMNCGAQYDSESELSPAKETVFISTPS
jgi:hypothetical protein